MKKPVSPIEIWITNLTDEEKTFIISYTSRLLVSSINFTVRDLKFGCYNLFHNSIK
jgi:hypothetical protein